MTGAPPVSTTCPYCGVGCGVRIASDGTVSGDPDHPANRGRLCSKGAALGETLASDGRLLQPQIGGRTASWDEALDLIADRFIRTIEADGPDAVAFYVSGQFLTEDYYVANKLMKGFIGSGNIDTNSRLCMASSVAGHIRAFGEDIVPGCYDDIEVADLVVLVGSNMAWCHPVLYQRLVAAQRGARHADRRHRSTADGDLRDRRPASGAAPRAPMSRSLRACCCISPRAARRSTAGSRTIRPAMPRRLQPRGSRAPNLTDAATIADVPTGDLASFYDWFAATERTRDALFARGQPVLRRHRQGQRDHQLPSRDRPYRPARDGTAVVDRAAQRDGRARGRRPGQPARRPYGL